jgi:hypothetical protein
VIVFQKDGVIAKQRLEELNGSPSTKSMQTFVLSKFCHRPPFREAIKTSVTCRHRLCRKIMAGAQNTAMQAEAAPLQKTQLRTLEVPCCTAELSSNRFQFT